MKAIGPEVILAKGTSSKIGKEVILESKNNPIEKTQTWITGTKDADGWFMIKDDANELILTAKSDNENPVVENNCFSTCLGKSFMEYKHRARKLASLVNHQIF